MKAKYTMFFLIKLCAPRCAAQFFGLMFRWARLSLLIRMGAIMRTDICRNTVLMTKNMSVNQAPSESWISWWPRNSLFQLSSVYAPAFRQLPCGTRTAGDLTDEKTCLLISHAETTYIYKQLNGCIFRTEISILNVIYVSRLVMWLEQTQFWVF